MKEILKKHLQSVTEFDDNWTFWEYREDKNHDALTDEWLENRTSYIYKVAVLAAIDANKCDWAYVAIGTQRGEGSPVQIIGTLHFPEGENDDMGRVLKRALRLIIATHPAFENIE